MENSRIVTVTHQENMSSHSTCRTPGPKKRLRAQGDFAAINYVKMGLSYGRPPLLLVKEFVGNKPKIFK
jgi:hypothetical protein